jgi:S-methylmethionine-dependent homocysteine/selenocysteine methylase
MPVHPFTLLDGGMGRELLRIGAPFRQPEWSALALIEAPDFVRRVHDSFVAAGADIITTNSYAIVPFHIGADRFAADAQALADLAGRLGRAAVQGAVRLAGSLPPVFGSYQPDLFRADEADALLAPLVAGLSPHVDLWLAETQSSIAEARAVRRAIGDDPRPFFLSFTLEDDDPDAVASGLAAPRLRSGETLSEAIAAAVELDASALLFNCSHAAVIEPAIRAASDAGFHRIGAYANAFAPHAHNGKATANETLSALRDDLDPVSYLAYARGWRDTGASIIGGCCGIGPDHIRALSGALSSGRWSA